MKTPGILRFPRTLLSIAAWIVQSIGFVVPQVASMALGGISPECRDLLLNGFALQDVEKVQGYQDGSSDVEGNRNQLDRDVSPAKMEEAKIWPEERIFSGSQNLSGAFLKNTSDGGYLVIGNTCFGKRDQPADLLNSGDLDIWVTKLSASGRVIWRMRFGGPGRDELKAIKEVPGGGFFVTGNSAHPNADVNGNLELTEVWVGIITADGRLSWQAVIDGDGGEKFSYFLLTVDIKVNVEETEKGSMPHDHNKNAMRRQKLHTWRNKKNPRKKKRPGIDGTAPHPKTKKPNPGSAFPYS